MNIEERKEYPESYLKFYDWLTNKGAHHTLASEVSASTTPKGMLEIMDFVDGYGRYLNLKGEK